jgi:branched-chain amino acid transport system ATP-binding protein
VSAGDVLLSARGLGVAYGGIRALRDVSFDVRRGEIVTLIGGNGAGKSSILRAISGVVPREGTVVYDGVDLARTPAHRIVALGIAHVPEGRGIFGNLTVAENLRLATWQRRFGRGLPSPSRGEGRVGVGAGIAADLERVFAIFPRLKERLRQPGGTLSGGEQQMLAVGRALMSRPRLLLLDEPSMGLAPVLVREIFRVLGEINAAGTTILLVEQNANLALHAAHRAHVLETGAIVKSGTGAELLGDPSVRAAYLGG